MKLTIIASLFIMIGAAIKGDIIAWLVGFALLVWCVCFHQNWMNKN